MQKGICARIILVALLFISMTTFASVQGVPSQDTNYWGYVTVDGAVPPTGTDVYTLDVGGAPVGNDSDGTSVTTGMYTFGVHFDDSDTSGTDEGVIAGETIYFYVAGVLAHTQAVNTSGSNNRLDLAINDTSAPSAPSSLTATKVAAGTINLTWSAATDDVGVQKYLIYRSTSTDAKNTGTNFANTTNIYYSNSGLPVNGTTYYYVVTAYDTSNEGNASNEANATTSDTTAPATPTGLTVSDVSGTEGTLLITWSANSESDLANYTLYFSSDNTSFSAETQTTTTNYTDTSLTDGSEYHYKLMAMDTSGNPSSNTSVVAGTPTDGLAPTVITGLLAVDVSNAENRLTISWTASVSADTAGYKLFKDGALLTTLVGINNVTYVDTAVTDGTQYTYAVSAYDEVPNYAANVSTTGTPIDDLSPKAVSGLSASASNHTVILTWSNVTQNTDNSTIQDLTGYLVYLNVSGTWTLMQNSTALNYSNTGLNNTVTYQFKVNAYDDAGNLGANAVISATPSDRPTITPSSASGSLIKSSVTVNISITSGQNLDTVQYVVYNSSGVTIDAGQTNTSIGTTSWTYNINPSSWVEAVGHSVYLFANDTNGQSTQENLTYTVDDTKPAVSGISPNFDTTNVVSSSQTVLIQVTIDDFNKAYGITATIGVIGTEVSMTNSSGATTYNTTTTAATLGCTANAVCTIKVVATDAAGNINNTANYTFTVDDINPAVHSASSSDADEKVKSTDNINITVNVTDVVGMSSVTVNGTSMTRSGDIWSVFTNASSFGCTSDGTCILTFIATDNASNVNNSETLTLTVDDTAPSIASVVLSDDYVQNNTAVVVTINVSDATTNVSTVTAEGTSLASQGNNIWNGTISLIVGNGVVDVVATDVVGNIGTGNSTTYTIDDVAPSINSVSLSDDYVQNGTVIIVTVNATDSAIYTVVAEGVSLSRSGDLWIGNLTLYDTGDGFINVTATDNASNTAANNSVTYTIDDTNPSINSVVLSDDYVYSGQVVSITVNTSDASLSNVTANSAVLVNTSADIWIGNITISSTSGVVTVIATDAAANTATDNSTAYTVDGTAPSIAVYVPASSGIYTNSTGTIVFNFTVSDASIALVNVSVDNGTYKNGSTSNGTHIWTFTGLKAGSHTAVFTAIDNAENSATAVSRTFTMVKSLNVTEAVAAMTTSLGSALTSFNVTLNETDVSSNESLDANQTLSLDILLNISGVEATAQIPEFNGLSANWERTFTVNVNQSSSNAETVGLRAGVTIQKIVLFQQATGFLTSGNFLKGARMTFQTNLGDLDVLYIDDDASQTIYKLSRCSSAPTNVIITTSNMCFTNTSANVTLYIPHFSGGALANDTTGPDISISSPSNGSIVNNSYFTLGFTAYEANPNTDKFCNYTLVSGGTVSTADYDIDVGDMNNGGSTNYTLSTNLEAISDGSYNLTVTCADLKNQSTTVVYGVTVVDSSAPKISAISTSSSGSSTVTVTLSVTTDETAVCRYSTSSVSYVSMTVVNTTNAKSHSHSISYTSTSSGTYYVLCNDTAGNLMSAANTTTYTADVSSSSTSSSTGGGTTTVTSPVTYTKAWAVITAGAVQNIIINEDYYGGVPLNSISFKPLNTLRDVQMQVRVLTSAPSSTGAITFEAYKYLQIIETNIDEDSLINTKISFRVEKSWLEEKGLSKENLALFRFTNNEWEEQPTVVSSETETYVYYDSETTGFSYFAIGQKGEELVPVVVEETEPETEIVLSDETDKIVDKETIVEKVEKSIVRTKIAIQVIFGTVAFVIAAFVFVLFLYKKHKHSPDLKLDHFIKSHLKEGYSKEEIELALLKVGWDKKKVEDELKKY